MIYYSLNDKMEVELDDSLKTLRILTDNDGNLKDPPDELDRYEKISENTYRYVYTKRSVDL